MTRTARNLVEHDVRQQTSGYSVDGTFVLAGRVPARVVFEL